MSRRIEYHPPDKQTIRRFAQDVAETLAERHNDRGYLAAEVVQGFADFLQVVAWIEAKRLNQEAGLFDKGTEQSYSV